MRDPGQILTNQVIGDPEAERLLLVDDEEIVRVALARYLTRRGYLVDAVSTGAEALAQASRGGRYALVLCDVRMPGMSGLELVPRIRAIDPDVAVVMLSALNDRPSASEAMGLGAMDYLTKPVDLDALADALGRASRRRRLAVEQRNVERLLQAESARLARLHAHDLETLADGAIHALCRVVDLLEAREPGGAGRARQLAAVAGAVATAIGLPASRVWQVRGAGHLATLGGLVAAPGSPGRAAGPLALDILSGLTSLPDLVEAVRDQEERWDGSGGPRGLRGDAISLGGRVLAAARAFTARTAPHPPASPRTADEAIADLAADAGVGLDPAVYQALTRVVRERHLLGIGADLLEPPAPGN